MKFWISSGSVRSESSLLSLISTVAGIGEIERDELGLGGAFAAT